MLGPDNLYQMDCVQGMRQMESESVDLGIFDPPFAINFKGKKANYNRKESNVIQGYQDVNASTYHAWTFQWMMEAKRVLKPSGGMFVVSGWTHLRDVLNVSHELDLHLINMVVWKYNFGVYTKKKFVTSHYEILYLCKDSKERTFQRTAFFQDGEIFEEGPSKGRKKQYADMEDVWPISRENWSGYKKSATKLPRKLIEKMLGYCSLPGDLVVDGFCGSGQVPFIAREMGRRYVAFEIEEETFKFAQERLETNQYLLRP